MSKFKKLVTELLEEAHETDSSAYSNLQDEMFHGEFSMEHSKWDSEEKTAFINKLDSLGVKVNCEEQFGGEGMGDQYWSVYSFEKDGEKLYVRFNGWYASYHGSEFVDWSFVEAKQKTITVYE